MKTKIIPILLIPLLALFTYQAGKNILAAVQLSNAGYLLQQENITQDVQQKIQKALTKVKSLTPDDPSYYDLQANLYLWEAINTDTQNNQKKQNFINQAKKYYKLGLKEQPNNPFLWTGLAQTDLNTPNDTTFTAISQANYFAPSDHRIQKKIIQWKLSLWTQLSKQQQNKAIEQLKLLISSPETNAQTRKQLSQYIKNSNYKALICSKLPRTQKFKQICF